MSNVYSSHSREEDPVKMTLGCGFYRGHIYIIREKIGAT